MSEYWVSRKKYFCKYCDIYIADDAPSRQQHESGLRHKGNTERFIRNLYKTSEKRKKDLDEEKRDMAQVEQAAQAAYAADVGAGRAKAVAIAKPVASSSKPPTKPSNPYTNYSTAASLGYTDPDAERLDAIALQRRMEGIAGQWELLPASTSAQPEPKEDEEDDEGSEGEGDSDSEEPPAETASLKREAETTVDEEDPRQFKIRKRVMGVGLGQLYDPGIIPIKVKKREDVEAPNSEVAPVTSSVPTPEPGAPKWTKTQWRRAGEVAKEEPVGSIKEELVVEPKVDITTTPPIPEEAPKVEVKPEEETLVAPVVESSGGLFRKRKAPAGGSRGKREV